MSEKMFKLKNHGQSYFWKPIADTLSDTISTTRRYSEEKQFTPRRMLSERVATRAYPRGGFNSLGSRGPTLESVPK